MKVLNIGSLNLDYVYRVDHFVQPGETLEAWLIMWKMEVLKQPGRKPICRSRKEKSAFSVKAICP